MKYSNNAAEVGLFQPGACVLWHDRVGTHTIPVLGVVLEQKGTQVLLRLRLHDTLQTVTVDRETLSKR